MRLYRTTTLTALSGRLAGDVEEQEQIKEVDELKKPSSVSMEMDTLCFVSAAIGIPCSLTLLYTPAYCTSFMDDGTCWGAPFRRGCRRINDGCPRRRGMITRALNRRCAHRVFRCTCIVRTLYCYTGSHHHHHHRVSLIFLLYITGRSPVLLRSQPLYLYRKLTRIHIQYFYSDCMIKLFKSKQNKYFNG